MLKSNWYTWRGHVDVEGFQAADVQAKRLGECRGPVSQTYTGTSHTRTHEHLSTITSIYTIYHLVLHLFLSLHVL